MHHLYKNWAKYGLLLAAIMLAFLMNSFRVLSFAVILVWLQFVVYLLHEFEEHVWPGGFKQFINQKIFHVFDKELPLNDANIFWINILAVWFLFPLFAVLSQYVSVPLGVLLPIFGLFNASLHIIFALRFCCYNPGLVVSLILNYPTGIYTLYYFYQHELLLARAVWLAIVITLFMHALLLGYAVYRYRRQADGE
ncbi:MAG: hypothetical protein A3F17_01350 [Gammaproteobacteria bacterium RIFCSPHIGHO2_12_FULL_41_15]|nr:MAG: hypothetical protein A3F17_01350 [Gammaproteobacteria bacterium RIFCSPHIGHO2_12_FULL_41_15]